MRRDRARRRFQEKGLKATEEGLSEVGEDPDGLDDGGDPEGLVEGLEEDGEVEGEEGAVGVGGELPDGPSNSQSGSHVGVKVLGLEVIPLHSMVEGRE